MPVMNGLAAARVLKLQIPTAGDVVPIQWDLKCFGFHPKEECECPRNEWPQELQDWTTF